MATSGSGRARGAVIAALAIVTIIAVLVAVRWRSRTEGLSSSSDGGPVTGSTAGTNDGPGVGGIIGTVTGPAGELRAGALVAVRGGGAVRRAVESDANGHFAVAGLPSGSYRVSASMPDGAVGDVMADVVRETTTSVTIRLKTVNDAVTFSGNVRDILGGPVPGAEVWVGGEKEGPTVIARAGPSGEFHARVAKGEHEVRVRAPGYAEASTSISLASDLAVELELRPASMIRGVVIRADGKGVAAVHVETSSDRGGTFESTTNEDGHFELVDLPPGTFRVQASTASEMGSLDAVNLAPASTRDVRIELDTAASARGVVRSSTGAPIVGARVAIEGEHATAAAAEGVVTGVDGTYRLAPILPGPMAIRACASGYQCTTSAERVFGAGAPADIDVTLRAAGRLRVRVVDKDGAPVRGAYAFLADYRSCSTGADGECVIDNVVPRKTKLEVKHVAAGYAEEEEITIVEGETTHVVRLATNGATVRGTVRWDDGKPAAAAHVYHHDNVTRTTADGHYELINVEPGYLHVRAATALPIGERRYEDMFEDGPGGRVLGKVAAGEVRENVDLVLARRRKQIAGTVVGPDDVPVAYARVGLVRDNPERPWRAEHAGSGPLSHAVTYSAADGTFLIERVSDGTYALWADADGQPTGRARNVAAGTEHAVIKLPAGGIIEGDVKDERGTIVTAFIVRGEGPVLRISDAAGHFSIRGVSAGRHTLVVEGYRVAGSTVTSSLLGEANVELVAGERKAIAVVVRSPLTLTGRVVAWPDMAPRAGVELHLDGPLSRDAVTGQDGRFRIDGAIAGKAELWTWDIDGEHEKWERDIPQDQSKVDVGDLAFLPSKEYRFDFPLSVDGKRAVVANTTVHGALHDLGLAEGDEIVSIDGRLVAPLSAGSLYLVTEALTPAQAVVVRKAGAAGATTVHRPDARAPRGAR